METSPIENKIIEAAHSLGFSRVGFAPADDLPFVDAFDAWIAENRHGEMGYMANHRAVRSSLSAIEPWAKSAIVCLTNYDAPLDRLPGGLRIARYAHGDDYHRVLRDRMTLLAEKIQKMIPSHHRVTVDTAPIFERTLAERAGLGWIGKNAMFINQEIGSFTFISQILVDIELRAPTSTHDDRCGTCSACLEQCPTGAIVSPQVIDARRCIAYWTIEHRGIIPTMFRSLIGDFWFGCDLCQDVCPWNAPKTEIETPPSVFSTREHYLDLTPVDILCMSQDQYTEWFRNAAIKRATYKGLMRNAAIVLGNLRIGFEQLAEQLKMQQDPIVRVHIAWAIGEFETLEARTILGQHHDSDPRVREEVVEALRR